MAGLSTSSPNDVGDEAGSYMKLLPTVARAVKLSQELPSCNTPAYIYYNDFPQYKAITVGHSKKILGIVQNILDILDAKANVLDIPSSKCTREKFCSLVDANDRILENMAVSMDIIEDPERAQFVPKTGAEDLVVAVQHKNVTSIEWLKPKQDVQTGKDSESTERSGSNSLLKLLSSVNIARPQASFSCPPDNSATPFRPKLVEKPNSITPLEDIPLDVSESDDYPHPYEAELNNFYSTIYTWQPLSPSNFSPQPLGANYHFIEKLEDLKEAVKEMERCQELAIDLEHHSYRSYLGITCLIQISTRYSDYIIDALALRDHLSCLNKLFTNPRIIKVFHGSDWDLMWLQRDFSVYVVNLFDTGIAARVLQLSRLSLSYLLQHYVNVKANKQYQLADWRIRPLPQELIDYARTDTHYLLYIAALMCQELQDRNLLHLVLERGQQQCLKLYKKPVFDPLGYLSLYRQLSGVSLSHRQLYALEHLFALRDSIARREDDSVHYVLPNHMLKVIAEVLPRESSGIFACCNPIPPLVRKYVHDLHKIILDARNKPIEELVVTTESSIQMTPSTENPVSSSGSNFTEINQNDLMLVPPHDFSYPVQISDLRTLISHSPVHVYAPSRLGQAIYPKSKSNSDGGGQTISSLSPNSLDPNRLFLRKILELLKKPCAALLATNTASLNQEANSSTVVVPIEDNQSHSPESIIKLPVDTPQSNQSSQSNLTQIMIESTPISNKYGQTSEPDENSMIQSNKGLDGEEVIILGDQIPSRKTAKKRRMRETIVRKQNSKLSDSNQSSVNSSLLSSSDNLPPFFARVAVSAEQKRNIQSPFDSIDNLERRKARKRPSAKNKRSKHQI